MKTCKNCKEYKPMCNMREDQWMECEDRSWKYFKPQESKVEGGNCETCLYHEPLGCVHREHTGEECVDKMGWQPKESKVEPEKEYELIKQRLLDGVKSCDFNIKHPAFVRYEREVLTLIKSK